MIKYSFEPGKRVDLMSGGGLVVEVVEAEVAVAAVVPLGWGQAALEQRAAAIHKVSLADGLFHGWNATEAGAGGGVPWAVIHAKNGQRLLTFSFSLFKNSK